MSEEFYTIVDDNGVYQVRAMISSPDQMDKFVTKLKDIHLKLAVAHAKANATQEKPSE